MYAAKSDGKSSFRVFEPSLLAPIVERRDLANELRRGVPGGEFVLHYQPLVALGTRSLVGLEALVRWNHPRHGLLGPAEFIPIAEESGAILPLGHWVLEEACRQAVAWHDAYPRAGDWTMSVNVSVRQLQRSSFLKELRTVLDSSGIDPTLLHLEVTESLMAQEPDVMLRRLQRIRALGVRIALDDFATGYSSLALLRTMPVDLLKIDRCFVADIGTVKPDRELVRVILELGRTLGIDVIAEGIENEEQVRRLLALGCSLGQGYYLGKPQPAEGIDRLLAAADGSGEMRAAA
jgi:EAL domain-containing protein (putative c-di-GMP-specific phosphodiesterase class I)